MVRFKWIKVFLFVTSVIPFTEAQTVKTGGDVTLPCGNVRKYQDKCDRTTWIFSGSRHPAAVTLFEYGEIHKEAKSKSDRLSVTENCSLVIKKVTDEDVGYYTCRQFDKSGRQQGEDSVVHLPVVPSEKTTKTTTTTTTTTKSARTTENTTTTTTTTKTINSASTKLKALVWFFIVIVTLAALIIFAVMVKRYKKRKGEKTQMVNENTGLSLNPVESQSGPETSQDTTDPEDGVSYASISFTKKTDSKDQVENKDEGDDEGDAVTYSTVKTFSSSAGASPDFSSLYAVVNKRQK